MYVALYSTAAVLFALLVGSILVRVFINKRGKVLSLPGNDAAYDIKYVEPLGITPLSGKNVLFLGSSVTYGASSQGLSFVEYLAKRNSFTYRKEAVGGTTLADLNDTSYVSRLKRVSKEERYDLFICQLSTNDASKKVPLGNIEDDDAKTVCGAINFIVDYVRETWDCPVVFYTNAYFDSAEYKKMVDFLWMAAKEKDFFVIDLFSDEVFNDVTKEERSLFMADAVHPTRAGYLRWWTPEMEKKLYGFLS